MSQRRWRRRRHVFLACQCEMEFLFVKQQVSEDAMCFLVCLSLCMLPTNSYVFVCSAWFVPSFVFVPVNSTVRFARSVCSVVASVEGRSDVIKRTITVFLCLCWCLAIVVSDKQRREGPPQIFKRDVVLRVFAVRTPVNFHRNCNNTYGNSSVVMTEQFPENSTITPCEKAQSFEKTE